MLPGLPSRYYRAHTSVLLQSHRAQRTERDIIEWLTGKIIPALFLDITIDNGPKESHLDNKRSQFTTVQYVWGTQKNVFYTYSICWESLWEHAFWKVALLRFAHYSLLHVIPGGLSKEQYDKLVSNKTSEPRSGRLTKPEAGLLLAPKINAREPNKTPGSTLHEGGPTF